MAHLLDPSMNWADVDEVRRLWKGPLLLKGVLHPAEAAEAVERGIDGVIVSNHGGRQLDGAVGLARGAAGVVEAVGGRIPVLLDGGVRRGATWSKALALGAAACLIGRPQLWGLSVAGEAGVAHVLDIFRREIDRAMGLVRRRGDIGPIVWRPTWLFREECAMPDFPIVDSHVHLYDVARLRYGWLSGVPKIDRTYLLTDFDAARGKVAVDKIVFAEVWVDPGPASAGSGLRAGDGRRRSAALRHGRACAGGEGRRRRGGPRRAARSTARLRGIRRLIEIEPDPSFCLEPGFLEGVRCVGAARPDLRHLRQALGPGVRARTVAALPGGEFVLDHIGKPGIKHGLREPWWSQMRELAPLPNVVVQSLRRDHRGRPRRLDAASR